MPVSFDFHIEWIPQLMLLFTNGLINFSVLKFEGEIAYLKSMWDFMFNFSNF